MRETSERVLLGTIDEFDIQTNWPGAPQKAVLGYCGKADSYPGSKADAKEELQTLIDTGEVVRFEDRCTLSDGNEATKLRRNP